jgi:hypothetical protein
MKCKSKSSIWFPQCNQKPYITNVIRNELNKCYNGQELPYLCKWKNKKKLKITYLNFKKHLVTKWNEMHCKKMSYLTHMFEKGRFFPMWKHG